METTTHNRPTTSRSWACQWIWWYLCEKIFQKEKMYEKQYCRPQDQRRQKGRRYSRCWADTPLQLMEQPVEKTTSEQISALQQPMDNPIPEQVAMFWRKLQPMGSNHAGAGSWQELWPVERRPHLSRFCSSPWKFHTVAGCKGMLLVGRTHTEAGENCEEEGL